VSSESDASSNQDSGSAFDGSDASDDDDDAMSGGDESGDDWEQLEQKALKCTHFSRLANASLTSFKLTKRRLTRVAEAIRIQMHPRRRNHPSDN
jgi:hypothetical protein